MGERTLRHLLIIGSSAVVLQATKSGVPKGSWFEQMLARKPRMLVTVITSALRSETPNARKTRSPAIMTKLSKGAECELRSIAFEIRSRVLLADDVGSCNSLNARAKPKQGTRQRLGFSLGAVEAFGSAGHIQRPQVVTAKGAHSRVADREQDFAIDPPVGRVAV